MKSKRFHIDQQIQKFTDELSEVGKRHFQSLRKKQDPLFKKIAALNAKADKLKYNRTGDPCPDCKGTGQMTVYTEKKNWWNGAWTVKEKKVPCKYCMED